MQVTRPMAIGGALGLCAFALVVPLFRRVATEPLSQAAQPEHIAAAPSLESPRLFWVEGPIAPLAASSQTHSVRQTSDFAASEPRLQLAPPSGHPTHTIREPGTSSLAIGQPQRPTPAIVAPSYSNSLEALGSDPYKPTSVPLQDMLSEPVDLAPAATPVDAPTEIQSDPERPKLKPLQASRNNPALRPVNEMAAKHVQRGYSLGNRNALFAARTEFIQALRIVAQSVDAQANLPPNDSASCSQALSRGLHALEEATDFIPPGSQLDGDLDLTAIIDAHRTPVGRRRKPTSQIAALQMYFDYARDELIAAAAGNPVASQALNGLGKTFTVSKDQSTIRLSGPKAMVFHQAALATDNSNHFAANELGVLLGKFGQWQQAKEAFVQSLRVQRDPSTWQNLAAVHEHLGEKDLARMAINERELMTRDRLPNVYSGIDGSPVVQWVDPKAFAGPPEEATTGLANAPANQATRAPAAKTASKPTSGSWWPWK